MEPKLNRRPRQPARPGANSLPEPPHRPDQRLPSEVPRGLAPGLKPALALAPPRTTAELLALTRAVNPVDDPRQQKANSRLVAEALVDRLLGTNPVALAPNLSLSSADAYEFKRGVQLAPLGTLHEAFAQVRQAGEGAVGFVVVHPGATYPDNMRAPHALVLLNHNGVPTLLEGQENLRLERPAGLLTDVAQAEARYRADNGVSFGLVPPSLQPPAGPALRLWSNPELLEIARTVNPSNGLENCTYIVEAVVARLHGIDPVAIAPDLPTRTLEEVEPVYNTKFEKKDCTQAFLDVYNAGPGAVGALLIEWRGGLMSHVATITNNEHGVPVVIEGQSAPGHPPAGLVTRDRIWDYYEDPIVSLGMISPPALPLAAADAGPGEPQLRADAGPALPLRAPFQAAELPLSTLARLGLSAEALAASGQLDRLLSGERTDALPLQVAGVAFEARLVLHRAPDGTVALKVALPKAGKDH